MLFEERQKEPF